MEVKAFNIILIAIIVLLMLSIYWFIPFDTTEFNLSSNSNSNFSLNSYENNVLQFYPNMRFKDANISYRIEKCPLQREDDMEWAFQIMEEKTILNFYPVMHGEDITITCEEAIKTEGKLFIAGEGGPTNITVAGDFNVIESGKILLMKDSDCQRPNIAIHELLHVLGFDHSTNPKNIMYEISRCDQEIGEDIIDFINEIYSIPAEPDLLFESASASMHGKYLDINFSLRNNGIKDSGESVVKILADVKDVEEVEIPTIEIGYGRKISVVNIWIKQIDIQKIDFVIENDFEELNKANNMVSFEIKK
ncbi:MAG: matrixin family metalloprotease [Candidatus Pacearchaeota archaeon]|nr:matrixin family metalloprotease [Candidatus Pacearchaeota archaeon]